MFKQSDCEREGYLFIPVFPPCRYINTLFLVMPHPLCLNAWTSFQSLCEASMVPLAGNPLLPTALPASQIPLTIYSSRLLQTLSQLASLSSRIQTPLMWLVGYRTITTRVIIYQLVPNLKLHTDECKGYVLFFELRPCVPSHWFYFLHSYSIYGSIMVIVDLPQFPGMALVSSVDGRV